MCGSVIEPRAMAVMFGFCWLLRFEMGAASAGAFAA
jgi:hypothetical protein